MEPTKTKSRELSVEDVAESVDTKKPYGETPNIVKSTIITIVEDVWQYNDFVQYITKGEADLGEYEVLVLTHEELPLAQKIENVRIEVISKTVKGNTPKILNMARFLVRDDSEVIFYLKHDVRLKMDALRERIKPFQSSKPFGMVGKLYQVDSLVQEQVYKKIVKDTSAPMEFIKEVANIENSDKMRCLDEDSFSIWLWCWDRVGGIPIDTPNFMEMLCTKAQMLHFPILPQPE